MAGLFARPEQVIVIAVPHRTTHLIGLAISNSFICEVDWSPVNPGVRLLLYFVRSKSSGGC